MDPLIVVVIVGIVVASIVGRVVRAVGAARNTREFVKAMTDTERSFSGQGDPPVAPGRYGQLRAAGSTTSGATVAPSLFGPTPHVTGTAPSSAEPATGALGALKRVAGTVFSGVTLETVTVKDVGSLAGEMVPLIREINSPGAQGVPDGWRPLENPAHLGFEWAGAPFSAQPTDAVVSRAIVSTVRGWDVVAFEYMSRGVHVGPNRGDVTTHHVVAARLPVALPALELSVEGPVGLLTRGDTGYDVFLGDAEFDARFRVVTQDVRFAREVLTPGLRAWLLARQQHPWRIVGRDVLVWRVGQQSVARVLDDVERVLTIAEAIPPHVLQGYGATPGARG